MKILGKGLKRFGLKCRRDCVVLSRLNKLSKRRENARKTANPIHWTVARPLANNKSSWVWPKTVKPPLIGNNFRRLPAILRVWEQWVLSLINWQTIKRREAREKMAAGMRMLLFGFI